MYRKSHRVLCLLLVGAVIASGRPALAQEDGVEQLPSAARVGESIWGPGSERILYLSLKECIHRALIFNREIRMKKYDIAKAEAKYKEADIIGRPVFEYEDRIAPAPRDVSDAMESFFSGDITMLNRFKLGIGVPLTTFGKISRVKKLAVQGIKAEEEKRTKKESEIVMKVRKLYYGVLLAREVGRLLKVAYKRTGKEVSKREEEGGTNPVELLKLKIFLSETEKRLEESKYKEIIALEAMRIQLGLQKTQSFDVARERLRPVGRGLKPFTHYRDLAFGQRADLKLLQIGARSASLNYSLEKRRYAPNLGVGAFFEIGRAPGVSGVTTTDDFSDPFNFTRAGIGFQLKGKFDFGTRSAKIRQAEAELLKVQIQTNLARDAIVLEVKKAYIDVKSARENLERAEEASRFARQLLFLVQSNFDIGLAEPKDLIDAISKFLVTRGEYFEAVYHYNASFAELDQKIDSIPETS